MRWGRGGCGLGVRALGGGAPRRPRPVFHLARGLERPLRDSRAARAGRRLGVRGARLHVAWTAVARATPARARLAADDDPAERLRLHARLGRPPPGRRPCPPDDRLRPLPVLRYYANPVAAGAREQPEGRQLAPP